MNKRLFKKEMFKSQNKHLQPNHRGDTEEEGQYISKEIQHEKGHSPKMEIGCQIKNEWKSVTRTTEKTGKINPQIRSGFLEMLKRARRTFLVRCGPREGQESLGFLPS